MCQTVEAAPVVAGAQPVILVEVRDVADLGELQPAPAAARRRTADLELAEPGGEGAQLLVGELLIAKHQDGMAVDCLPEGGDRGIIDPAADIEPADRGTDMRMQRRDREGHGRPFRKQQLSWLGGSIRVPGLSILGEIASLRPQCPLFQLVIARSAATQQSPST